MDEAALDRMSSICTPSKTAGDPAAIGRKGIPSRFKDSIESPVARQCNDVDGEPSSFITMIRDEKSGQVASMEIFIRSNAISDAAIDHVLSVAVDPWIKVVAPAQLRDLARRALAHPSKLGETLDGPTWTIAASLDHGPPEVFSLNIDPVAN